MSFSREEAKEFACEAIDEIFDHKVTSYELVMRAAVDEVPTCRITFDSFAVKEFFWNEDKLGGSE